MPAPGWFSGDPSFPGCLASIGLNRGCEPDVDAGLGVLGQDMDDPQFERGLRDGLGHEVGFYAGEVALTHLSEIDQELGTPVLTTKPAGGLKSP